VAIAESASPELSRSENRFEPSIARKSASGNAARDYPCGTDVGDVALAGGAIAIGIRWHGPGGGGRRDFGVLAVENKRLKPENGHADDTRSYAGQAGRSNAAPYGGLMRGEEVRP